MVQYHCERCGIFSTNIKSHYLRHLNRKIICKPLKQDIPISVLKSKIEPKMNPNEPLDPKIGPKMNPNEPFCQKIEPKLNPNEPYTKNIRKFKCNFCEKTYTTNSHMNRHMKNCKNKDNPDKELLNYISNQIDELKEQQHKRDEQHALEKSEMRNEIETLLEKVGNVINNITHNQQNIYINNYGQENLSYITSNYLNSLLKKPYGAIPKLIKDIHFHPKHPENMNIKITNKKLSYAKVWEDNKWSIKDKNEIINNMVDKGFNIIEEQYEENEAKLDCSKKQNYEDFQKKFSEKDKELHKNLEKNTEIIIINNS